MGMLDGLWEPQVEIALGVAEPEALMLVVAVILLVAQLVAVAVVVAKVISLVELAVLDT
tara:strand:+ start:402 stop:578 length:177 start_codon:yes stop_codon:yes gene_type:complete